LRILNRRSRRVAAVVAAAVAMLGAAAPAFAAPNSTAPSVQNWGVWKTCGSAHPGGNCAQIRATAENSSTHILYAVGDFTDATNTAGTASLAYSDLVAIDETTGAVVTSFRAHKFNGRVDTVAVDQATNRVYVGGSFTTIDGSGVHAQHAAAFDATSGNLLSFNARADKAILALLPANGVLYLGGQFTSLGGTPRGMLAAVDPATGAVLPTFAPPTIAWSGSNSPDVRTLVLGADGNGAPMLYVGGHFDTVGGSAHLSVFRADPITGALDTGFAPKLDAPAGDALQAVDGIVWVDGSAGGSPGIVVAQAGHFNRAYRFDTAGNRIWYLTPDGDMQAVAVSGSSVYFGGHFQCVATAPASCYPSGAVTRIHIAAFDLATGAVDSQFAPKMNPTNAPYYYGVWSLEVTSDGTLWAGGVFTKVWSGGKTYQRPKLAAFPAQFVGA
jgi:hypothetical protein